MHYMDKPTFLERVLGAKKNDFACFLGAKNVVFAYFYWN